MPHPIDTMHLGCDRVICAWERDGVIVDPGPASCAETVLAGLQSEPRALLLTHIHLDHAGAAGVLAQRFPRLRIYVHEKGAPHVVDPSRLWRSAARLYGEQNMLALWGETPGVEAERVTALSGGEVVEGMSVLYSPGHASHHVVYLDEADGSAYVGDVAGVRIPGGEVTVMPTPPPEIDVESWRSSIKALAARAPARLMLTHFGEIADAAGQLTEAESVLDEMAGLARAGEGSFKSEVEARIDAQPPDVAERMRRAMPPEQAWLGLERYWRRRAG